MAKRPSKLPTGTEIDRAAGAMSREDYLKNRARYLTDAIRTHHQRMWASLIVSVSLAVFCILMVVLAGRINFWMPAMAIGGAINFFYSRKKKLTFTAQLEEWKQKKSDKAQLQAADDFEEVF